MLRFVGIWVGVALAGASASGCALRQVAPGVYRPEFAGSSSEPQAQAQPAAPQAAATPAPAAAPVATAAPVEAPWVTELPEAATVKSILRGSTDEDTAAQQDAALTVMMLYESARSGQNMAIGASEGVSPLAAQRFGEYRNARTKPRSVFDKQVSPLAEQYVSSTTFQTQVLSALLSPPSVAAYQSHPIYQQFEQDEAQQRAARRLAAGIVLLSQTQLGGAPAPSRGSAPGQGATGGEDIGAKCRANCNGFCPGAYGVGEQWEQSQAAYNSCLNEIQRCKTSCP